MFNAAIERGTGVRRLHITEEAQMKENVCVDCKYYESCGKPERYIKCMGTKRKNGSRQQEKTQLTCKTDRSRERLAKTKNGGKANGAGNGKRQGY